MRLLLRATRSGILRRSTRPAPPHLLARADGSSSSSSSYSSTFRPSPSPPRLPADQQAEFERLQRAAADRLADPTPLPHEQPPSSSFSPATGTSRHTTTATATTTTPPPSPAAAASAAPPAAGPSPAARREEELPAGGVWRGARPEFEGDRNPRTGEIGGPKTEPLRWGSGGDWSYNGRVTDF